MSYPDPLPPWPEYVPVYWLDRWVSTALDLTIFSSLFLLEESLRHSHWLMYHCNLTLHQFTFAPSLPLQRFSGSSGLLPLQKELFELLQRSCDLEAASLEHGLSAALTTVQLARREGTIDQLLQQGATLLEMVEQQRALLEEHSVSLPTDLSVQYQEAATQQRKLALQVTAEKQLPLISKVNIIIHSTCSGILALL